MQTCQYQFRDKSLCGNSSDTDSQFCFWHNPDSDKTSYAIKSELEEKTSKGESLEGYRLAETNLDGINLTKATLVDVDFTRANLRMAHMFGSNLEGANLFKAHLDGANMKQTKLDDAQLLGAHLGNAEIGDIGWAATYIVKNEREAVSLAKSGDIGKTKVKYQEAEEIYRNLKTNHKNRGLAFEAGYFFYREMVMMRKQMPLFSRERFFSFLGDLSTGYGENPQKIIGFSFLFIFVHAVIFSLLGIQHGGNLYRFSLDLSLWENLSILLNAFYFSVVTYVTLGYGDYTPYGFSKIFAVFEAFFGPFLVALFVVTVYKRYMER